MQSTVCSNIIYYYYFYNKNVNITFTHIFWQFIKYLAEITLVYLELRIFTNSIIQSLSKSVSMVNEHHYTARNLGFHWTRWGHSQTCHKPWFELKWTWPDNLLWFVCVLCNCYVGRWIVSKKSRVLLRTFFLKDISIFWPFHLLLDHDKPFSSCCWKNILTIWCYQ